MAEQLFCKQQVESLILFTSSNKTHLPYERPLIRIKIYLSVRLSF